MADLITQQKFQEQMQARIRQHIGELLPDEMLAEMVKRGVEQAFFEKRVNKDGYYGSREQEPWLTEFLRKELATQMEEAVRKFMAENQERIASEIQQQIAGGFVAATMGAIDRAFRQPLEEFRDSMQRTLSDMANRY